MTAAVDTAAVGTDCPIVYRRKPTPNDRWEHRRSSGWANGIGLSLTCALVLPAAYRNHPPSPALVEAPTAMSFRGTSASRLSDFQRPVRFQVARAEARYGARVPEAVDGPQL